MVNDTEFKIKVNTTLYRHKINNDLNQPGSNIKLLNP